MMPLKVAASEIWAEDFPTAVLVMDTWTNLSPARTPGMSQAHLPMILDTLSLP